MTGVAGMCGNQGSRALVFHTCAPCVWMMRKRLVIAAQTA
jgi:hypothetical protein